MNFSEHDPNAPAPRANNPPFIRPVHGWAAQRVYRIHNCNSNSITSCNSIASSSSVMTRTSSRTQLQLQIAIQVRTQLELQVQERHGGHVFDATRHSRPVQVRRKLKKKFELLFIRSHPQLGSRGNLGLVGTRHRGGGGKSLTHDTMRFHPESPFGKAWYAYYAANQLEKRTEEERREEYNKFSKEWKAPPTGPDAHR